MASQMEDLRKAIILDCEESLTDPRNGFSSSSEKEPCACYNNLKVALRVLKTDRSATERYFQNIEHHVLNKPCKHIWQRDRMNSAIWAVLDSKR
jgi:hypothetical protein